MRRTLTIDDDANRVLKEEAHQRGSRYLVLVDERLPRPPMSAEPATTCLEPFRVASAARGFHPGVAPLELDQLNEELQTDPFLR